MKCNLLRRTLAITVAAAMAVSSAPASLSFAEELDGGEVIIAEDSYDDAAADTASAEDSAAASVAEAPVAEEAATQSPEVSIESIDSVESGFTLDESTQEDMEEALGELNDTTEAQALRPGVETDQFAITNLRVDEDGVLHWTTTPNRDVDGWIVEDFEISISDSKGRSYFYDATGSYAENASFYAWSEDGQYSKQLSSISAWGYANDPTNGWTMFKKADGSSLSAFRGKGLTYRMQIRAGGYIEDPSSEYSGSTWAVGKWSAPVEYTIPAAETPMVISNVKIREDGYLTSTSSVDCERYEIRIRDAVNPEIQYFGYLPEGTKIGAERYAEIPQVYINSENLEDLDDLSNRLVAYEPKEDGTWSLKKEMGENSALKDVQAFQPGHGYLVSLRGVNYDSDGNAIYANAEGGWSAEIPYTRAALKTAAVPGKVTGMRQYLDDSGDVYVAWDRLAKDVNYDLRITDGTYIYAYSPYSAFEDQKNGTYILKDITSYQSARYQLQKDNLYAYQNVKLTSDGTGYVESTTYPEYVKNETGAAVMAFAANANYTIQVRAHRYSESDEKELYGAWSDPLPVNIMNLISPKLIVNGLALRDKEGTDNDSIVWDAEEGVSYKVEITDKDAAGAVVPNPPVSVRGGQYTITDCVPGHTYTFRVCASLYGEDGAWSAPIDYAISTIRGNNAPLDAVTGLTVKTDVECSKENGNVITSAWLQWNPVADAEYYELVIESAGYSFVADSKLERNDDGTYSKKDTLYNPGNVTSLEVADFAGRLNAYEPYTPGISLTKAINPTTGKALTAYDPGSTYTVKVQAVRKYYEWNPTKGTYDEKEVIGAQSNAVTYTVGVVAPITDLRYLEAESQKQDEYYYFTYTADPAKGSVYYQISRDENFADCLDYQKYVRWEKADASEYRLAISKRGLVPGTVYYIRAVNSMSAPTETETAQLAGVKIQFTTDAERGPATITGLKQDKEYETSFSFLFDAVLEADKGDQYELQYAYAAPEAETSWRSAVENSNIISKSLLQEGINYIRAVAYIVDRDGVKKYGVPSNVITVTLNTMPSVLASPTVNRNQQGYVITFANVIRKDEEIELEIADSKEFVKSSENYHSYAYDSNDDYVIPYTALTPGIKYYLRARAYSWSADTSVSKAKAYGAWTDPVTISPKLPKFYISFRAVTSDSLQLGMDLVNSNSLTTNGDYLTGYQIQRKSGKKWLTLAYTTDNSYQDSGLETDTKYRYRVRPYYYANKKYTYGPWNYKEVVTWGAPLNLIAKAASKNSVKLAWDKVSGADGYEIYRMATSSEANVSVDDYSWNSYSKMELIKTITKSSTKAYVDKDVNSNLAYVYNVKAYKTVNKKKYYISDEAHVDLTLNGFRLISLKRLSSGKVKVKWNPVYTASGYLIEKKDSDTGKWTKVATKSAKTTSYTFNAAAKDQPEEYRIRAYKGSDYSDASSVKVAPYLAAPTNVKAVVSDGGIKITWKAVAGADYYTVYRLTSAKSTYYKEGKYYVYDEDMYSYDDDNDTRPTKLPYYVEDASRVSGYRIADDDELTGTTFVDKAIAYKNTTNNVSNTLYDGPKTGVQYYYYVVAHRKGDSYLYKDNDEFIVGLTRSGGSEAASATVTAVKVAKPTSLKATATKGKVTTKWKKVKGVDGYVVYRSSKKNSGFVPVGYLFATSKKGKKVAAKNSFADTTVTAKKTYYYKVRAFKVNEAGAYTYSADLKTPAKVKAK